MGLTVDFCPLPHRYLGSGLGSRTRSASEPLAWLRAMVRSAFTRAVAIMTLRRLLSGFIILLLVCSVSDHAQHGPIRIPITPNQFLLTAGGTTTALNAHLMFFSNTGAGKNVTTGIHWSSSNPTIASIGASTGIVTPNAAGTVLITATSGPFHSTAWITVLPSGATINSVTVSANPVIPSTGLPKGLSNQFLATAQLSNGSTQDITDISTWASSAPSIASIHPNGPLVGIATATASSGTTTITATPPAPYAAKVGSTSLKVGAAVPVRVSITPPSQDLPFGSPLQLTAVQTFSDNTTQNVTTSATWTSSNTGIATVTNNGTTANGTLTTTGIGQVTITATLGSLSGTAAINVTHSFDVFGGLNNIPCTATGFFHTQKVGNQWWLCTPVGHGFFMTGVYVMDTLSSKDDLGSTYAARVKSKYGDTGPTWSEVQDKRLEGWGFNSLGTYASLYALPVNYDPSYPLDTNSLHSHPTKLSFIQIIRPGFYSMIDNNGYLRALGKEPVKNMLFGVTKQYTGFIPSPGEADLFNDDVYTWMSKEFIANFTWKEIYNNTTYQNYMIGIAVEDSDELWGFGATDALATFPLGANHPNLSWLVATLSPVQTANSAKGFAYKNTIVVSKIAWRNMLVAKYGTIASLNTSWGSNYTTFNSSGTCIGPAFNTNPAICDSGHIVSSSESIATGDGLTLTFNKTLAKPTVTKFSLSIKVNGQPMGGDNGNGVVWGPNLNGTVNYSTGAVSISFATGHAPPSRAAITADYMQNGWGIGTGVLDEDARISHQKWIGIDFISLTDTNANAAADLGNYLFQIADHFFSNSRTQVKARFPNYMYVGPDTLGRRRTVSRKEILQAAAKSIDIMLIQGIGGPDAQASLDYAATYYGDKPMISGEFRTANADSGLFRYSDSSNPSAPSFTTQQLRGADYLATMQSYFNLATTQYGDHTIVGTMWWQYVDNFGERLDWGVVSTLDNAYDGQQAVQALSADQYDYRRGGEERNYGDALTSITQANQYWIQSH